MIEWLTDKELKYCKYDCLVLEAVLKKGDKTMKNNEVYNVVKINNLALNAITPKILDALLELDEKCELDIETVTLDITIKCLDVKVTSRYYDDCYDNREYISTNILFNNKTAIVLERDMYTSIEIA